MVADGRSAVTPKEQEELMAALEPVVEEARKAVLAVYRSGRFDTQEKADHSPVTAADKVSHDILVDGLRRITPEIPVISEESVGGGPDTPPRGLFWLVDPLDGTKEFIRKSGEFTINLALVDDLGIPQLGIIDVPIQGRTYRGSAAGAAVLGADGATTHLPRLTPISEARALAVALSRSHQGQAEGWLDAHQIRTRRVVYAGSAIKFCWIAEGRVDLYVRLRPTMGWDTAAGQAIVEAVGGSVCAFDGTPLTYLPGAHTNPNFIASAPRAKT